MNEQKLAGVIESGNAEIQKLSKEIAHLNARFEPYLTFMFEGNKEPYKQFFQASNLTQSRVCVRSPVSVSDVELVANRVEIDGVTHDGIHLRPRHDRNERGTKRVALKPFKEDAWDVVTDHHPGVVLSSIAALGVMSFSDGAYEFELMVTGGDSFPATKIVKLQVLNSSVVSFDVRNGRLSDLTI
jgi:hypothetical protein